MRTFIVLSLLLVMSVFATSMYAQCQEDQCDPVISGVSYGPNCIALGATSTLTIEWQMLDAIGGTCTAPAGSWYIQISLGSSVYGITGVTDVTEEGGINYFDWTYDPVDKNLFGVSNQDITSSFPIWFSSAIFVEVTGQTSNACSNNDLSLATCGWIPGVCAIAFQDNPDNNSGNSDLGVDITLPLELDEFIALNNDCESNSLFWVQNRIESDKSYVVERRIDDGLFTIIGEVPVKEFYRVKSEYTFNDNIKLPGKHVVYYRLKQVDADGNFHYSKTISVHTECNDIRNVRLYPNPVINKLKIDVSDYVLYRNEEFRVEILDTNGSLYLSKVFSIDPSTTNFEIDVKDHLDAGNYMVKVIKGDTEIKVDKIVVVK